MKKKTEFFYELYGFLALNTFSFLITKENSKLELEW